MSISQAIKEYPEFAKKYTVPKLILLQAILNGSAVFSDGALVTSPKGVRCPYEYPLISQQLEMGLSALELHTACC